MCQYLSSICVVLILVLKVQIFSDCCWDKLGYILDLEQVEANFEISDLQNLWSIYTRTSRPLVEGLMHCYIMLRKVGMQLPNKYSQEADLYLNMPCYGFRNHQFDDKIDFLKTCLTL